MDAVAVTKTCSTCSCEKPVEAFSKSKMHKNGRRPQCKDCFNAHQRDRYQNNHEYRKRVLSNTKRYTDASPEVWKQRYLMRTYNITLDEYNALLEKQGGVCAICGREEEIKNPSARSRSSLAVDHCHETGRVRGLLCFKCNTGIGALGDTVESLRKAIRYLESDILYTQDEVNGWMQ